MILAWSKRFTCKGFFECLCAYNEPREKTKTTQNILVYKGFQIVWDFLS